MWHCTKVYNMLNYDIQKGIEKVNVQHSLNIESSKIYKKYREENWHSKYLHSHTLKEVILNQLSDRKSYLAIKEKYEKGDKTIKGKPRQPRFKQVDIQNIHLIFGYGNINLKKKKDGIFGNVMILLKDILKTVQHNRIMKK